MHTFSDYHCGAVFEQGSSQEYPTPKVESPAYDSEQTCAPQRSVVLTSRRWKIALVWTRSHSSLYQRVSFNVTREVCRYFGEAPFLLTQDNLYVNLFSPETKQFSPLFEVCNWTFMGAGRVFMSVCNYWNPEKGFASFAVYAKGQVTVVEYSEAIRGSRSIYDSDRDCVYIFGGVSITAQFGHLSSKRCQRFSPSTYACETLPDMLRVRSGLVYLCAGSHPSIDTFDPVSLLFTEVAVLEYAADTEEPLTAVPYGGDVVVLSKSFTWRGREGQWVRKPRNNPLGRIISETGSSVVWGRVAYLNYDEWSVGVDLESGEEVLYPVPSLC